MIINNVSNFDDEPMEVDPGTPLFSRQLAAQHSNEIDNQTPISPNSTRPVGPKIVKSIRPPIRMARESLPSENGDKGYEFDENINPFQSKPKIGFDSATSSSSSISNENNSEYYLKEDTNPFQSRRGLGRSPSPNRLRTQQEENCQNVNEDEWENHKKRSSTSRRSNLPCSPTANQSTSVSVVSSTTDLSSSSSISPQETQKENNQKQLIESNDQELNDPFKTPQKTSKFAQRKSLSTTLTDNDENSAQLNMENSSHNTSVNNNSSFLPPDCVIFDSIFSNESEFQSFLDLLEKNEKDNTIKKSPSKFSEFARKSLYIQFDPIIQNCRSLSPEKIKRLSIIRDKQESIKFFLSEIVEEENEQNRSPNTTSIDNQSLVDSSRPYKSDSLNNENTLKNINVTRRSSIVMENSNEINQTDHSEIKPNHFESNVNPDELFEDKNLSQTEDSKRKSSFSSNLSLDHSKINETNCPNSSILDLDRMHISRKTNANETAESFKLLTDESMLDDVHLLNKSNANNSVNSKSKVQMTKSVEKKCNSLTSSVTSVTGLSDDDTSLNPSMSKLIAELNSAREREKSYLEQIRSLNEENKKFRVIVVEFETIIQNMDNNREDNEEKLRNEILELTKERDHLQEDVIGVERAFDDLHRRFEKLKVKVEEFKKNEDGLQNAIESYKQQLDKERAKYSTLKKHAEEKLEFANNEIEKLRKTTSIELQTLRAELRKAEIKISSLELSVQQKDQENTELTNLLEDLLSKVKPNQK